MASILRSDPMFTTVGNRIWLFQNFWLSLLLSTIFLHQPVAAAAAKNNGNCPPSSCGNIQDIHTPFRLDTDPSNCGFSSFVGDKNFSLSCHNNSSLFLYLKDKNSRGGRFLVKGINYDNFTIHLVDSGIQPHNCSSLPNSPISLNNSFASTYYTTDLWKSWRKVFNLSSLSKPAVLISCDQKPINYSTSRLTYIVEVTASCETKRHSYWVVGVFSVPVQQVVESCRIDMMTLVPFTNRIIDNVTSYQEFHTKLSDGFHLSWFPVLCEQKCTDFGVCVIGQANRPTCISDYGPAYIYYTIRAWFLTISGLRLPLLLSPKRYWGPIFKITGWLLTIFTSLGALHVVIFFLGSPFVLIFLIYQWRRRHLSLYHTIEEFLQNHNDLMPIRYSFKDIKTMTSHFKDRVGEGGFGCVYKGKLRSGRLAAIKILDKSWKITNGQDFMNEVATLGRIHHMNVIQLVGYCVEQSKNALIYDFMPNSSLDKYIFPKDGFVSLSWDMMFEISLGVARGIEYLHRGCDMQILHFDIKPHNILLDENFIPKISDFGLAKLYPTSKDTIASLTAARGTIGYMAPELFYKNIGRVSYKADVYSFGMLLLEIAGKRKNLNALAVNSSQIYFPSWVYGKVCGGEDIEIGENATERETKLVRKMIIVGLWCIQMNPNNRPSMNKVVEMLEGDMENLEMPPKPSLCPDEMPNVAEIDESSYLLDDSSESISLIE